MINTKKQGFTLIELLVVVAIIGLLASVIAASLGNARIKARDIRRISDLRQLQNALELYNTQCNQQYPTSLALGSSNGCPAGSSLNSYTSAIPDNQPGCTILGGTAPAGTATLFGYTPGASNSSYTVYFCTEGPINGTPITGASGSHQMTSSNFVN